MFELSFDARVGTPALDRVSTRLGGRTLDGMSLDANITPLVAPPLTTSSWQSYHYFLELPAAWDGAGIHLSITFSADQHLGGITHTAYLDNVSLTQVPEPSTLALIASSTLLAAAIGRLRNAAFKRVKRRA